VVVRLFGLFLVFVVLTGCVGDQHNTMPVSQGQVPSIAATPVLAPPEVTKADLNQLRSETIASNNAAQQSQTGALNAALGKFAEKATGIEGDVSAVKAALNTHVQIMTSAVADIKNSLSLNATAITQIRADVKADLQAEFQAKLDAQASVNATAVAALKSEISNLTNNLSAGRDVNQTQFTKDMAATLDASYKAMVSEIKQAMWAIVAICHIFAGIIIAIQHGSVKHEREQHASVMRDFKEAVHGKFNSQQPTG
jgi:hypothetical protein